MSRGRRATGTARAVAAVAIGTRWRWLLSTLAACSAMGSAFAAGPVPVAAQAVVVRPPVRVSPPGAGAHFWWTIGAASSDGHHLVVCGLRNRGARGAQFDAALYGSEDGGESWRTLYIDSTAALVSEVACALGRNGTTYFAASTSPGFSFRQLVRRSDSGPDRLGRPWDWMRLRRSTNFGESWRDAPRGDYADAAVMLVQSGPTSGHDRVVLFSDSRDGTVLVSTDGARTLGTGMVALPHAPIQGDSERVRFLQAAAPLPDGTFGALYLDVPYHRNEHGVSVPVTSVPPPLDPLTFNRVARDGVPIGAPIVVTSITQDGLERSFTDKRWASIAVGSVPGSSRRRVYVAWHDAVKGRVRILLASSDDSGITWTSPRVVDDLPSMSDATRDTSASHASLAVNGAGVVGLQWAEFDGRCWRFAASRDGGVTFGASVPLNTCAARPFPDTRNLGVYLYPPNALRSADTVSYVSIDVGNWRNGWAYRDIGLVAMADSTFRAAWVPHGDGNDALYVSTIGIDDTTDLVRRRALVSDAVQGLSSGRFVIDTTATVDFTQMNYDERTNEFTIGVVVIRPSGKGQTWPVVVRVHRLSSVLGPVRASGADNALPKEGAAWVFDGPASALPSGSGAALDQAIRTHERYEFSKPQRLRFRVDHPPESISIPATPDLGGVLTVQCEIVVPRD